MTTLSHGENGVYEVLAEARAAPALVRGLNLYWEWRDNALSRVPDDLDRFVNLEFLVIEGSWTPVFDSAVLRRLPKLDAIVLRATNLRTIPSALFDVPSLVELVFANHEDIGTLDGDAFDRLPRLREVGLAENGLVTVPPSLRGAPLLSELDLSMNALASVPSWLAELPSLRRLDLSDNALPEAALAFLDRWVTPSGEAKSD